MKRLLFIFLLLNSVLALSQNNQYGVAELHEFTEGTTCTEKYIYSIGEIFRIEERGTKSFIIFNGRESRLMCDSYDDLLSSIGCYFLSSTDFYSGRRIMYNRNQVVKVGQIVSGNRTYINVLNLDGGNQAQYVSDTYDSILGQLTACSSVSAGSGQVVLSTTQPTTPFEGMIWREPTSGITRAYDADGVGAFIVISNSSSATGIAFTESTTQPATGNIGDQWKDDSGITRTYNGTTWEVTGQDPFLIPYFLSETDAINAGLTTNMQWRWARGNAYGQTEGSLTTIN